MRFCGVDPGLSGAVAFIRPDAAHPANRLAVFDAPLMGGEFDGDLFAGMCATHRPDMLAIEHAFSRPGQGVASTFKFGKTFGQALGVIQALKIPYQLVSPSVWKKHFKILPSSPKDASRLVCKRLYPGADIPLMKHHGRADAILLAHFAWQSLAAKKMRDRSVVRSMSARSRTRTLPGRLPRLAGGSFPALSGGRPRHRQNPDRRRCLRQAERPEGARDVPGDRARSLAQTFFAVEQSRSPDRRCPHSRRSA